MSQPPRQATSQAKGVWPIETTRYDRSAELTALEQEALNHLLAEWGDKQRYTVPKALARQLLRLLQPLYDIQHALGVQRRSCSSVWSAVYRGMQEHKTAYWAWSEHEWSALLTSLFLRYPRGYAMPGRIGNRAINSSPSPTVWDLKPISCFPSSRRSPRSPSLICSLGKNCWTRRSRGLPKCS